MKVSVDVGYVDVDVGYVDVDVELDDIDTEDLISEIESRGLTVLEDNDPRLEAPELSKYEITILKKLILDQNPAVGSELYFIHDMLARS